MKLTIIYILFFFTNVFVYNYFNFDVSSFFFLITNIILLILIISSISYYLDNKKNINFKSNLINNFEKINSTKEMVLFLKKLDKTLRENSFNNTNIKKEVFLLKYKNLLKLKINFDTYKLEHTVEYNRVYENSFIPIIDLNLLINQNLELKTKTLNAFKLILINYDFINLNKINNLDINTPLYSVLFKNKFLSNKEYHLFAQILCDFEEILFDIDIKIEDEKIKTNDFLISLEKNDSNLNKFYINKIKELDLTF